jgi:hypothetical protein
MCSAKVAITWSPSFAQQAVVDEHAGELVADGLVQQGRHHRGIHAAGQAEQHLSSPTCSRTPAIWSSMMLPGSTGSRAADVAHEALEDALALAGCGSPRGGTARRRTAFVVGHAGDGALSVLAITLKPGGSTQ